MTDIFEGKNIALRQQGWLGQSGQYYPLGTDPSKTERGGFSPLYIQVGTYKIDEEVGRKYISE